MKKFFWIEKDEHDPRTYLHIGGLRFNVINQWRELWYRKQYNWINFDFALLKIGGEDESMTRNRELEVIVLGLGFRVVYDYGFENSQAGMRAREALCAVCGGVAKTGENCPYFADEDNPKQPHVLNIPAHCGSGWEGCEDTKIFDGCQKCGAPRCAPCSIKEETIPKYRC